MLPSLFMSNFFCLVPNTSLAFVAISKNAVTFLKKVAIYNATNKWTDEYTAHAIVGYHEDSPYLIPVKEMENYEMKHGRLIKFAVWRSPMERLISTYKYFCLEHEYRQYFHFMGLYDDNSFERFMEFLQFEWDKKDYNNQDEHIRRQVDYYSSKDVDYIVPIERVFDFLKENEVLYIKEKSNKTTTHFIIKNEDYKERINSYYKKDWGIKCNY